MVNRRSLMRGGEDTVQQAEKVGVFLARIGFAMRGVLYALIGIVTLYIACGTGKPGKASKEGALQLLAQESGGYAMLVLVVVGFVFYGLWLLSMAIRGTTKEHGWKAILFRVKCAFKAAIHFVLAAYAANMLSGSGSGSGGGSTKAKWTAKLMEHSSGRALIGLIGVIVVVIAFSQFKKAWDASFMDGMGIEALQGRRRKWILIAGRVGISSRGFILTLVGLGIIGAAIHHNTHEATKGIDGALRDVASYPYGQAILILMAIGFWCFAAFQIACACWARID